MDRRAGGVNPALPDFLGLFCLSHGPLLLSMFVTYLYSFIKGKQVGSTQIPPTLYALCPASFTVLFPVNGSWIILCPSLIYGQPAMISDVARLLFSSAASPDHHVQDTLLRVEFDSFRFCCCHFLHPPFPSSLCLSMVSILKLSAVTWLFIEDMAECLVGWTGGLMIGLCLMGSVTGKGTVYPFFIRDG